jgi:predicted transcriptional regulator
LTERAFKTKVFVVSSKPKPIPILTRVESALMALFWKHGPMTVADLHLRVPDKGYTSLATLVKILEQKGYLTHTEIAGERAFLFAPAVEPRAARRHHVRDLVERLFAGRSEDLLVGLLDDAKLSRPELEALRAVIDQKLGKTRK